MNDKLRLSQSIPRGLSESFRHSIEVLDDPILPPVYQTVVERRDHSINRLKPVKSEPVQNGYLAVSFFALKLQKMT